MKVRVTLQAVRDYDLDTSQFPGKTSTEVVEELRTAVEDDPYLYLDADSTKVTVTAKPV